MSEGARQSFLDAHPGIREVVTKLVFPQHMPRCLGVLVHREYTSTIYLELSSL